VAAYQDAIHHGVTTINPDGCAPGRGEHSVNLVYQTTICGRTRYLTDDNPLPCSLGISKACVVIFGADWPGETKERTNNYVNFQAESVALPPDAAGAAGRPARQSSPPT
jgi:hypothetical protein